tara:strand:+ start:211 stop:438 length:228 start_codon:yes stop_codon:yes gene_type:complete
MDMKITKYEKVQLISARAKQIAEGAPSLVDVTGIIDAVEIANKEFTLKKIPIIIVRTFPGGKKIEYDVNQMTSFD